MRKYLPFTIAKNFKFNYVRHAVADFETCFTSEARENVRVWAWGMLDYMRGDYQSGNDISSFMDAILNDSNVWDIGFHNLRFDGSFIIPRLFKMGFQFMPNEEYMDKWAKGDDLRGYFTHNITNMGQWFSIIITKKTKANKSTPAFVQIWDTAKLFPNTKLKELAKQYNTSVEKIDETQEFYERIRPAGYRMNDEEAEYLKHDCIVLAEALRVQLERYGTIYRTQASKAFTFFKEACTDEVGHNNYKIKYEGRQQWAIPEIQGLEDYHGATIRHVPFAVKEKVKKSGARLVDKFEYYIPDYYAWNDIKRAYFGGISYVNPLYIERSIYERITVIDVNSMYPYCLRTFPIPYGPFRKVDGAPDFKKEGAWIAAAYVSFKLKKPSNLPCIQMKDKYGRKWLSESSDYMKYNEEDPYNDDLIFFTSVDFETYKDTYDFTVHKWLYHYYFPNVSNKDGKTFIDPLYKAKQKADNVMTKLKKQYPETYKEMDEFIKAKLDRQETKILMNSAYGKHGTKYFLYSKISQYISANEPVKYTSEETLNKTPDKDPSHYYCPYAAFVTAYARRMLVTAWNTFEGRAVYCDTDSIHFIGTPDDIPAALESIVDRKQSGALGLWGIEGEFTKARYIRSKTYIEVDDEGVPHITCAGAPPEVKALMNWETFRVGFNAWRICEEVANEKEFESDDEREAFLNSFKRNHSKLKPKQYPDGVALEAENFEIKPMKL